MVMATVLRTIKSVVVDDETPAVNNLKLVLEKYCDGIEVVGQASSALEGIKIITEKQPEIVFLDIEMPYGDGFKMLEGLPERSFHLVFTTAYEEYAIKAIKQRAADYLLKPIEIEAVMETTNRIRNHIDGPVQTIAPAPHKGYNPTTGRRLALPDKKGISYYSLNDVIWFQAEGVYTRVGLRHNKTALVSRHLKEFEKMLSPFGFIRSHRSFLVNLDHVKEMQWSDGTHLIMSDNKRVEIARRTLQEIKDLMQQRSLAWS